MELHILRSGLNLEPENETIVFVGDQTEPVSKRLLANKNDHSFVSCGSYFFEALTLLTHKKCGNGSHDQGTKIAEHARGHWCIFGVQG